MNRPNIQTFLKSPRARLAGTYLAIIMIMSIGFSVVLYHTSSHELGRQIPPDSFFRSYQNSNVGPPPSVDRFLRHRVDEGRDELLTKLILLNLVALLAGGVISYLLAKQTLKPIEEAMEAQAQFISDASHELRTPLTAIQATNEVALRRPKLNLLQAKEVIRNNMADIARLKDLTDGLLSLAQQQNKDIILVPVSLQEVVGEALNQIVSQATNKDIAVHDEVPDIAVIGDKTGLAQSLVILLDNAVKYSPEHSNVYLAAEARGKFTYLTVRDEGIGIRASDIPHVFRRFYRADSSRTQSEQGGYGLGLAIAQRIIIQHGGTISVASQPRAGTTFTIKLTTAPAL